MSEKKGIWKFVNLFDIIVTAIVIVAAAALIFIGRATSAPEETAASTVNYVMVFEQMQNGSENLIRPGDKVMDKVKKYEMGSVVSVEVTDAYEMTENTDEGAAVSAKHLTGKDAYVTVTAPCTESESAITVGGGFNIRIGEEVSVQGPGWHGTGYVVDIIR